MKSATNATNDWMDSEPDVYLTETQFKTLVDSFDAFAEERVEESELRTTNQMMVRVLPNMIAKARAEAFEDGWNKALEEALKVADLAPGTNGRTIAKEIRALK